MSLSGSWVPAPAFRDFQPSDDAMTTRAYDQPVPLEGSVEEQELDEILGNCRQPEPRATEAIVCIIRL